MEQIIKDVLKSFNFIKVSDKTYVTYAVYKTKLLESKENIDILFNELSGSVRIRFDFVDEYDSYGEERTGIKLNIDANVVGTDFMDFYYFNYPKSLRVGTSECNEIIQKYSQEFRNFLLSLYGVTKQVNVNK